ncbi:unnamed protein product [Prunus armeniaca]
MGRTCRRQSGRSSRQASDTDVVPAEGSPILKSAMSGKFGRVTVNVRKEVKMGALHKVSMWDFVQVAVVVTRVLGD